MKTVWIGAFWVLQIAANLAFKYGTTAPNRYWPCFIVGNVIGVSSIFFMMKIYNLMDANLALAIAGGGTFLLVQVSLALAFNLRPTGLQWWGILAVTAGMILASFGSPATVAAAAAN